MTQDSKAKTYHPFVNLANDENDSSPIQLFSSETLIIGGREGTSITLSGLGGVERGVGV